MWPSSLLSRVYYNMLVYFLELSVPTNHPSIVYDLCGTLLALQVLVGGKSSRSTEKNDSVETQSHA